MVREERNEGGSERRENARAQKPGRHMQRTKKQSKGEHEFTATYMYIYEGEEHRKGQNKIGACRRYMQQMPRANG